MEELLTEFILRGVALPLVVSLVLTGVIHFALPGRRGLRMAGAAMGLAFLLSYGLIFGWSPFPPVSSAQRLPYLVLCGLLLGAWLDYIGAGRGLMRLAALIWPALIIGWLSWRQLSSGGLDVIITAALLWLAGAFILILQDVAGQSGAGEGGAKPHTALLIGTIGASGIAFLGSAATAAQAFGVLAAATGGFLLWNWPRARHPFGAAAVLGGTGTFVALAASLVLFSEASRAALGILILSFLSPRMIGLSPFANRPALGPFTTGLVSVLLAALALMVAHFSSEAPLQAGLTMNT